MWLICLYNNEKTFSYSNYILNLSSIYVGGIIKSLNEECSASSCSTQSILENITLP